MITLKILFISILAGAAIFGIVVSMVHAFITNEEQISKEKPCKPSEPTLE